MGIMKEFFNQTRKPEGILGKLMLSSMNSGHDKMADWGLSHLPELRPERIVELGCGAGRNAGELLKKYPQAHVTAIDYSPLSVEKAEGYNRESIAAGRCIVQQGDVSDLQLSPESFDLATAGLFLAGDRKLLRPGGEGTQAGRLFSDLQRIGRPGRHGQKV